MDRKRLIFIIIFAVATIAIAYGLYRVFFAAPRADVGAPDSTEPVPGAPGSFPSAGTGQPGGPGQVEPVPLPDAGIRISDSFRPAAPDAREVQITDQPVVGAKTVGNGAQFYNQADGKFYRIGPNGELIALSDQEFFNVEDVVWSPNNNESIIEYPDGSNIYYNFETKRQVTLPKHWDDFSFSSEGEQIAAKSLGFSPENRWLIASDPDGGNTTFIEHLGNNQDKVIVDWSPSRQVVALSRTGAQLGADRQEVLLIGQNKENFKSLIVEGRGLKTAWSNEGKQLLYSVYNSRSEFKPELWVVDANGDDIGQNRRPLSINTWADKCAFANERFVYCGIPTQLDVGAGFQPTLADSTPDRLFRIDLTTGIRTEIPLDRTHTINTISVSEDGRTLHFTDKTQNGLFRVGL